MQRKLEFSDLLGKVLLTGLTYYTHDDQLIEQKQFYGEVVEANETWVKLRLADGSFFTLPPDLRSTKAAVPGEYRLRSTGEIVVNPDFLSTWTIHQAPPDENE